MRILILLLSMFLTMAVQVRETQAQGNGYANATPAAVYMLGGQGDDFLYQFKLNDSGQLRLQPIPTVISGKSVSSFAATEDGRHLYVANYLDNTICQYSVDATGALSPLRPATVFSRKTYVVTIDPDDRYLFALQSEQRQVTAYRIGVGGRLTASRTSKVPVQIPLNIVIDPNGSYAYVIGQLGTDPPSGSREIDEFKIGADGSLKSLNPASIDDFGGWGAQMFTSSSESKLFVADGAGISRYEIQTSGQLKYLPDNNYFSPDEVMAAIDEPYHLIFGIGGEDPEVGASASKIIITAIMPGGGLLTRNVYDIGRNGNLSQPQSPPPDALPPATPPTPAGPPDANLAEPTCVTVDQKDQILYVLDARSFDIFRYSIGQFGSLTELLPPVASGHTPQQPNTANMTWGQAYFSLTIPYVLVVRRPGMK